MTIETRKALDKLFKALENWDSEKGLAGEIFDVPGLIDKYYPGDANINMRPLGRVFYEALTKGRKADNSCITGENTVALNGNPYRITPIDVNAKRMPYKIEALG